ncbi:MAG: glycosyltransferase family 2 protein [Planctomycetia bacterium]|nr:glycosyltransferase family 2 protein [Planctomycetia bacterium]
MGKGGRDAEGTDRKVTVSIVIVSFNTRELTLACLKSVLRETRIHPFEVLVVDNASSDGSAEAIMAEFEAVRVFSLRQNEGFARANNIGAEHARGEYLLLLNPDTVILDQAIDRLIETANQRPDVSIFGGKTLFPDGTLNPKFCFQQPTLWSAWCRGIGISALFKGNRVFDPEMIGYRVAGGQQAVDVVSGCFFLIRKELWRRLGGFDCRFRMYAEETDLCLRAAAIGEKCVVDANARIVHYGGASESIVEDKYVRLFAAKARLFRKHWAGLKGVLGVMSLDVWAATRVVGFAAGSILFPSLRSKLGSWRGILSRRREWTGRCTGVPDASRLQGPGA